MAKKKKNPDNTIVGNTVLSADPKPKAEPKPLTVTQKRIYNDIYKPLVREAIRAVEKTCSETSAEFTLAAVCTQFAKLAEEPVSSNRFRDILDNCGFVACRITKLYELPTEATAPTETPE